VRRAVHIKAINAYRILVEKPKQKGQFKDLGFGDRLIPKCLLNEWDITLWNRFIWLTREIGSKFLRTR
jgi:hypothetical protein